MEQMMSREEFAEYLKISIQTVDRARNEGMPSAKIMGTVRIPVGDAVAWMKNRAINGCEKRGI